MGKLGADYTQAVGQINVTCHDLNGVLVQSSPAMKRGRYAIARVVIQTKQHLAALIPSGPMLVLYLLRWEEEIRTFEELALPPEGIEAAGLTDKEIKMGELLVEEMSGEWDPHAFNDSFKQQILALVEKKVAEGQTASVAPIESLETSPTSATVYDLTELLQRSLNKGSKDEKPATRAKAATSAKRAPKPRSKPASKEKAA